MALVAFDFDGTLSDDEMIVLLGERASYAEEIATITERAMRGELSYAESLRRRVALLEGLPTADATAAFDRIELRDGMAALLRSLTDRNVTTAILTGGFEAGVEGALERADAAVNRIVANRLVDADGRLTGEVEGPLIEGSKGEALSTLAREQGVDREATIAVGDGANDVPMLEAAGTAIGFRPKATIRSHCDVVVEDVAELEAVFESAGVLQPAER